MCDPAVASVVSVSEHENKCVVRNDNGEFARLAVDVHRNGAGNQEGLRVSPLPVELLKSSVAGYGISDCEAPSRS